MGKYKIQIKVDLVECSDDSKEYELRKENNGSSTMVISEKEAESIDNCERAVLQTAHPTIRDAIAKHLSEISKKKPMKKPNQKK